MPNEKMYCSRCGRFMRKSTYPGGSDLYLCTWPCPEVRSGDPDENFGLLLLGFAHKAADNWLRDPLTGAIAVCVVEEVDIFEDVTRIPFSDRARAEAYVNTVKDTDDELVTIRIEDF